MRIAEATDDSGMPEDLRRLWLKALSAYELRNFEYSMSALNTILVRYPDFAEAKALLKKCEDSQNDA